MNPRIRANRKSILLFLSVLDHIIQELREKVETAYSKQHTSYSKHTLSNTNKSYVWKQNTLDED